MFWLFIGKTIKNYLLYLMHSLIFIFFFLISISLIIVFVNTHRFFTSWDDTCHGFSDFNATSDVILCASHLIGYILCLLMLLSCIIKMVIKYGVNSEDNFHQIDYDEYTPLLGMMLMRS
jgi:hypothetical protein